MTAQIVVPCFNEANRWHAEYWDEMFRIPGIRWTFVDDGSTDGTAELLEKSVREGTSSVQTLSRNGGKAEAVRLGMRSAITSDPDVTAVGYMDADGAFDAGDVAQILSAYNERVTSGGSLDAVWSSRVALAGRNIERSTSRHYIGRVIATFVSIGQKQIPYDTQSGLKLFAVSPALEACLDDPFRTRWLFELELLSRWQRVTGSEMRIWEEPLNYWHDVPGSKIHGRELVRIVRELGTVKIEQRKARR